MYFFSAVIPIPSHIKPDEGITTSLQLPVKMTTAQFRFIGDTESNEYGYTKLPVNLTNNSDTEDSQQIIK